MATLALTIKVRFPEGRSTPVERDYSRLLFETEIEASLPEGAELVGLEHVWLTDGPARGSEGVGSDG